jgi:ribose 5-phosphate isomerase A
MIDKPLTMEIKKMSELTETPKFIAASKALDYIDNNMIVGLGTGTTAALFIDLLGQKYRSHHLNIRCVATSEETAQRAKNNNLPLLPDSHSDVVDVCVDGADECSPYFHLIKGGGGALLREKIVAQAAKKMIVIADDSKYVETLGQFPLPIEILCYEQAMILKRIEKIYNQYAHSSAPDFSPIIRKTNDGNPFLTDLRHNIIDLTLKKIEDPISLAHDLQNIAGIVEHGLFLNEAS